MKHEQIKQIALDIFNAVESKNTRTDHGHQRFYVMKEFVNGKWHGRNNPRSKKLLMYGLYDYQTKKSVYFFTGPNEDDEANLRELASFGLVDYPVA